MGFWAAIIPERLRGRGSVVPVVRLQGAIGMATPLRPGVTLSGCARALETAFSVKTAPAVAIIVNSPGGSPVQSRLIYQRIRALAEEKGKTVLVYLEDVAASGGYMIAIAGDEIIADPSSVVGSIGVVSAGFGFHELIDKIGVERRVYTSGERKVTLDAFRPEDPEDVAHLKALQRDVHETFIEMVRARRGGLLSTEADLFSGLFWTGRVARSLGLVDGLGDIRSDLRRRFGDKVKLRPIGMERGFLRRRIPGASRLDIGLSADDLVSAVETRALWARYGL